MQEITGDVRLPNPNPTLVMKALKRNAPLPSFEAVFKIGVASSFAAERSIMELPLFKRAMLIIKKFETLHQLKYRPYYGYGHRILPGEHFPQHRALTGSEADALLRKDLKKFCAIYSQYGKDSVLLGTLAYNIGPGAVNKSSVVKKLKSGDRNIFKPYTSHCRYKGKWHRGLYNRRLTELTALFIP